MVDWLRSASEDMPKRSPSCSRFPNPWLDGNRHCMTPRLAGGNSRNVAGPNLRITCHSDVKIFEENAIDAENLQNLHQPGAMSTKRL